MNPEEMTDLADVLTPEEIQNLSDTEMREWMGDVIVLMGLALTNLLRGKRFDKKELADDLESCVQVVAVNIARRNEKKDLEEQ